MEVVITDILRIIRISFEKEFYPDYKVYFLIQSHQPIMISVFYI